MHCHKSIALDTVKIATERGLLAPTNYEKDILGNLSRGMRLAWFTMRTPKIAAEKTSYFNFKETNLTHTTI